MKHRLTNPAAPSMGPYTYRWFLALRALEAWAPNPRQFKRCDAVEHIRVTLACSATQALHCYEMLQQKGYIEKA